MSRKVLQDFTLSDGTVLPAGCVVNVAARGVHHDSVSMFLCETS